MLTEKVEAHGIWKRGQVAQKLAHGLQAMGLCWSRKKQIGDCNIWSTLGQCSWPPPLYHCY